MNPAIQPTDSDDDLLVIPADPNTPALIKIIGVGGGGCNAVGHMYRTGIPDVRFLVCNSDHKALENSPVPDRLQIGPGLGAGGKPEVGRALAEKYIEDIRRVLDKDTKMVFITAGMGGGTGTGASPIIAREAKQKGILTVGIVTTPFLFERERRIDIALDGVETIAGEVDALLVINNQRLCEIYPRLSVIDAFARADDTLTTAAGSIVEIISMHGRVGLDFRDVHTVLKDGGVSIMSTGYGEGDRRITQAIREALHSPLLNNNDIYSAERILLCITFSPVERQTLMMEELDEITRFMQGFDPDIETKYGMAYDESLGNRVKVTILASGFGLFGKKKARPMPEEQGLTEEEKEARRLKRERIYGRQRYDKPKRPRLHTYIYNMEDLGNETVISAVDDTPTLRRTREDLRQIKQIQQP